MVRLVSEAFVDAMARLAAIPDSRCSDPWEWPGHTGFPLQVRDALYRSLEEELEAVAAQASPAAESARLLAVGQRAWGELRGLLVGLPDELLELPERPGSGEEASWTLRQVLGHVLLMERRYREHVEYALRRSDSDPVRTEPAATVSDADQQGGVRDWILRIAAEREAVAQLRSISAEELLRPTVWVGYAVNVRFRMLRFAAHLVEHMVQAEKLLASSGPPPGEAHLIVRRISAARGAHELFTDRQELARLDAVHGRRAADLNGSG
jgi:uncharacterized damage-inducible protein DinB